MDGKPDCVADVLPGLVWATAPGEPVVLSNNSWHECTGPSVGVYQGGKWQKAILPGDQAGALGSWQAIHGSNKPGAIHIQRRFDGISRWCLLRARRLIGTFDGAA
jgi:hypothetical protein